MKKFQTGQKVKLLPNVLELRKAIGLKTEWKFDTNSNYTIEFYDSFHSNTGVNLWRIRGGSVVNNDPQWGPIGLLVDISELLIPETAIIAI